MDLTPGTRVGSYEIVSFLGAGGMGEVYRASDSQLRRQVALKILPVAFAGDLHRLARFKREAELLAALSHPTIAAVYGLERSGLVIALAMELVEGEDLTQVIARGPMPLDDALRVARQMAEALEAAHEQGIVHRDLKPGNVKLRRDGVVKVLDFGLAKAMDPSSSADNGRAQAMGASTPMTREGAIVGTSGYMAPEQAQGRPVDRRADIWAFGAVLYEMLTGQRAFSGAAAGDLGSAAIRNEPDWSRLPTRTPANIRTLIHRCLEPDPKRRLDSAAALRLEIDDALTGPARDVSGSRTRGGTGAGGAAILIAAVLGLALAGTLVTWAPRRPSPGPVETRTDIVTPATDDPASFALSPDGRQIVFASSVDGALRLWLRHLSTTTAQPLAGTEGGRHPFWAPDSRSIGFFTDSALKRLDLDGGAPQTVAPASSGAGGTWTADGSIVFAPSPSSPLMRVSASGGTAAAVTSFGPQQMGHRWPDGLPDGHRFLYYAGGPPEVAGIYVGTTDGGASTRLTPSGSAGVHLRGEWLMWVRAGALVAQRLDLTSASLTGEPVTVADGVAVDTFERSAVSASAGGLLAYRLGDAGKRQLTWMDRTGTVLGTIGDPDTTWSRPRIAPDGQRVVVARTVQGNQDLWLLDRSRLTRFTFDAATDDIAIWSPDSSRVVFTSTRTGGGDLYQKLASGAGPDALLVTSPDVKTPSSWSADGRFVLFHSTDAETSSDLWVASIDASRPDAPATASVWLKTPYREVWSAISPDGRWLAYMSNESGRPEVYVRPFSAPGAPQLEGQWQVSTSGGIHPVWRPDGRELYYIDPNGSLVASPIAVRGSTLDPGTPLVLFATRILGGGIDAGQGRQYDVSPDGRFLINTVMADVEAPITLVQHWRSGS